MGEHYVPQSYLRRFATSSGKLCCFDKVDGRVIRANTVNIAHETGFFQVTSPSGETRSLEPLMASVEPTWERAIDAVIAVPSMETVAIHAPALAEFMAIHLMRTVGFRRILQDVWQQEHPGCEMPEDQTKALHARFLLDRWPTLPQLVMDLRSVLLYNPTSIPFWTSDNPVALYAHDPSAIKGMAAEVWLRSPGIRMHLPLQPGLALCLFDPQIPVPFAPGALLEPLQVWELNRTQVRWAERWIISPQDNFGPARALIAEIPELREPRRQRVERIAADAAPQRLPNEITK